MDNEAIVFKTSKGLEEVETKKYKLSQRARTVLILVDGNKTAGQVIEMARQLGSPATLLDDFVEKGLVDHRAGLALMTSSESGQAIPNAPPMDEAGRFRLAHKFMTTSVVNTLGIRAFFFTLKLERCATRKDLLALLDDYTKAIAKGGDAMETRVLTSHARELLM